MPVRYQGGSSSVSAFFLARLATTANIANLNGGAPNTVDGVAVAAGNIILVKNQAAAAQNGLYVVVSVGGGANGVWLRWSEFNSAAEVKSGILVSVSEGAANLDTLWMLTTNDPITVGVTGLAFGLITAGGGLTGAGTAGEISFFNGPTNIISDQELKWDNVNKRLGLLLNVGSPNSTLHNNGSLSLSQETLIQLNYNITKDDFLISAVLNNLTATLPLTNAAGVGAGKIYILSDDTGAASIANPINLTASGAELIDGLATRSIINPFGTIWVRARVGGSWKVLNPN